jgi:HEAT repeat protein
MENIDKQPVNWTENLKPAAWAPDLSMYEISGQDAITEHSFNRYLKDKEQDSKIEELSAHPSVSLQEKIEAAPLPEKASLIRSGLENPDINIQKEAALTTYMLPEIERQPLEEMIMKKIREGLQSQNGKVRKTAAEMISSAPREDVAALIRQALNDPDAKVRQAAAFFIYRAQEEEIASLVRTGLANTDLGIQKISAKMAALAPGAEVDALKKIIADKIKRESLDQADENSRARKAGMDMIYWAPEADKVDLTRLGLEDQDIEVQKAAARNLSWLSGEEKISLSRIVSVKMEQGLEDQDAKKRRKAVVMFSWAADEDKERLFNLIKDKGLGEQLIKSSLYRGHKISRTEFSRHKFDKTGSETTLLGGELRGKTIIRHIKPQAFLAWQKLYENQAAWQEAGFDYVPIEPIQSYRLNPEGLVDVATGALDLNLADWDKKTNSFKNNGEFLQQRRQIMQILSALGVKHGHPHAWNFCLRFFRDDRGVVDLDRAPRLYLIDFDEAVLAPKSEK